MASEQIDLEIVTPEGRALKESVNDLTAPSVDGEFGVLPGHRPMLAALKTGIVAFHKSGQDEERVAVGPGFVEIAHDRALLLTDKFMRKAQIDPVIVRRDLKEADEAIDRFEGEPKDPKLTELISKARWCATLLELYGDPPPPIVGIMNEFEAGTVESYRATDESSDDPNLH
jgi:F-type H+-transporting ATPase subunit epsilon